MKGTLFLALICAASMTVPTAQAQNIYADIATGMAKQGIEEAEKLLEKAPALLREKLKRGQSDEQFETAQFCRGALQSAINLGAALSNIMPFSKVWTLEDERGPVGRFRIMLNGEKIHADVYCEDNLLRSIQLPWGIGSADLEAVQVTAFSAIAGAGRIQVASATASLKAAISSAMASAGVFQSRVFLGRLFIRAAMSLSQVWLASLRSVPLGMNCRSKPLVFSLLPRCQGACGSSEPDVDL